MKTNSYPFCWKVLIVLKTLQHKQWKFYCVIQNWWCLQKNLLIGKNLYYHVYIFVTGCKRTVGRNIVGQPQHPDLTRRYWNIHQESPKDAERGETDAGSQSAWWEDERIQRFAATVCGSETWSSQRPVRTILLLWWLAMPSLKYLVCIN